MELTTLGRTGLPVSIAGLGCGGHSRLGLTNGASQDQAVAVVHRALDLGINLIDTARAYGTEEIVGRALAGRRDEVIVSTKAMPEVNGHLLSAEALRGSVEKSLGRLRTDYVDLFFVHGLGVQQLDHCRGVLAPELARMRDEGRSGSSRSARPSPATPRTRRSLRHWMPATTGSMWRWSGSTCSTRRLAVGCSPPRRREVSACS